MTIQSKPFTWLFALLFIVAISILGIQLRAIHNAAGTLGKVKVEGGYISGTLNAADDVYIFKGIPFAAPPVGDLRWRAPGPVKPWSGVRKCDAFGPSPMQGKPAPFSMWSTEFLIPAEPISEDCLYLNVWTGAQTSQEKRPVLVWIYGGGFVSGGSGVPIYDGEAMAKKGVVFVSINYRVGIFGFFAHPQLTTQSGRRASGNYGLMDQIAALKWVQHNIAAFGGDPRNVTIAGQSAGSMSGNCLVASPQARGLFHRAIAESGAGFINRTVGLQQAETEGIKVMRGFHLTSINALRAVPAEELMKLRPNYTAPIIDGYVLPDAIPNIFKKGKANKVDLLTGWNEEEGLTLGPIKNALDFQQEVKDRYGESAVSFLQYYPASNDTQAEVSQLKLARDIIFGVQNYSWANTQSELGGKTYVYRFVHRPPATGEYSKYGAFHTAEVPYAFNNLQFVNRPWKEADRALAEIMSSYWANFARSGNPNWKGLPVWEVYKKGDKRIMLLGEQPKMGMLEDEGALEFMSKRMAGN